MAVASSSASKLRKSGRKEKISGSGKEAKSQKQSVTGCSSPAKRTKCPVLRVIGSRIYDPQNGKTCHQCRQKTMDFAAACGAQNAEKSCTIKYCHKCLLNRYGEKAEEVSVLEDWKCPRCRGICNCSFCMKKRGHLPTGILAHTAKATGFSSVSEMLVVQGPENVTRSKIVKDRVVSPEKLAATDKEPAVVTCRKRGKENSFDETSESNKDPLPVAHDLNEKKSKKKKKCDGLKEVCGGHINNELLFKETKSTNPCISDETSKKDVKVNGLLQDAKISKRKAEVVSCDPPRNARIDDTDSITLKDGKLLNVNKSDNLPSTVVKAHKVKRIAEKFHNTDLDADIQLPQGTELTTLAGLDLLPEDVGHALQFLEYCAAFGEILNLKKGQPESILRDITRGRSGRGGKYSAIIQFHIHLLSLIHKDLGKEEPVSELCGENSWLNALKDCISESQCSLKEFSFDRFLKKADAYDCLDSSMKLRLLNFLCDEALGTVEMRNWIDDESAKFAKKIKEAKERVNAAKAKEKDLRQKLQNEVAKAIIARNGAPLTISEHDAIFSQIKIESAQARAEMVESKGMVLKKNERSDAIRTESVLMCNNGRVYWRLKGYSEKSEILLQDIRTWDGASACEKWFALDEEQGKVLKKIKARLLKC